MAESEKSPSTADAHKTEKPNFTGCLVWIMLLFLILWLCWPKIVSWWSTPSSDDTATVSYSDIGSFGDLFGSFNALVSMLAFIGFLCALYLQRKDLQLQREEMKQSRREMELQTTQFREQTELLKEQIAQQNKQNKIDKYVDFAYKIYEKIDEFDTMHKGGDFIKSIQHLLKAYIYKKSGLYMDTNVTNEKHSSFMKLYFEIGSICEKIHRITQAISNDNDFTEDDRRTVAMVLLSTCGSEMLVALDYYLLIAKTITNNPEIEPMLVSIFRVSGSDAAKNGLIRTASEYVQSEDDKSKANTSIEAKNIVDAFLYEIKNGNRYSFI